jgi:heme A synthase
MIAWTLIRIVGLYRDQARLLGPVAAMAALLVVQVTLGAMTVWSQKAVMITTFHVANGAVILGISALLTLRAFIMVPAPGRAAGQGEPQTA